VFSQLYLKRRLLFVVVISLLFIFQGCLSQKTKYKIGTWKTAQTIQPFFFHKVNQTDAKIDIYTFTNPADQKAAVLAKSLDMAGTTIAHAIHSASQGQPIVVVAGLCNKASALVVSQKSDIYQIKDLRSKRIAYVPGTMHEILLRDTLVKNGLSPELDVELIRIDFFDMGTALANGDIDAFLSGEPFPTLAIHKGYGRLLAYPYYDVSLGSINAGMIVHRDTIKNNPEEVLELVRLQAMATEYLSTRRQEWLEKANEFGIDQEILDIAAKNIELFWQIDESYIERARILGAKMERLGVINKQPDYDALFDLSFVKKVKEELSANQ